MKRFKGYFGVYRQFTEWVVEGRMWTDLNALTLPVEFPNELDIRIHTVFGWKLDDPYTPCLDSWLLGTYGPILLKAFLIKKGVMK